MKHEMGTSVPSEVWTVRLDSRRRPTFPEAVMKAAGLEPGSELRIHVAEHGCIVIETPEHVRIRAKSRIKTQGSGREVQDFLAERAAESKLA
jgi:bifunctional DNA-binding transcriptional regulator/antitoxin component of YhaV-PrlF toxin-antitoxin module